MSWLTDFLKKLIPAGAVDVGDLEPGSDGIQAGETYGEQTAAELETFFKNNPTGSIVENKRRLRAVKAKERLEKQTLADTLLDKVVWPKSVAEMGEDSFGRFVKVYLDGKVAPVEDELSVSK